MTLGLPLYEFTLLHVAISLVAILSGLLVLPRMLRSESPGWLTHVFLATTVLTSVTGFLFPTPEFTPAKVFGVLSLVLLAASLAALYVFRLAGPWRWIYASTAVAALYLNCFVLVVQAFQKVPGIAELAPTQTEPPFQIAQGVLLVLAAYIGYRTVKSFHPVALR
ncbi:hypothetical protein [Hyphomicrobium sp.]|uniref:hypothetical protein n=1 Tax=Hyphomicrobium sp. TaxID=82 RepID=UPI003F6F9CA4